jgi:hypothetical protein
MNLRTVLGRGSLRPFSSSQMVRVLDPVALANPRAEYPLLRLASANLIRRACLLSILASQRTYVFLRASYGE